MSFPLTTPSINIEGKLLFEVGDRGWNMPELRHLLEQVLPERIEVEDLQAAIQVEGIGTRILMINARQIYRRDVGQN